jgi:hypothetical protein
MLDLLVRGRSLVFDSPLTHEEVTQRLQPEIAPPAWRWSESRPQLFEGTFSDGRFWMMRLVRGRNSFRPVMEGQVVSHANAVRIDVRMRLHPLVIVVCVMLMVAAGTIASLAASQTVLPGVPPLLLFVVVFPLLAAGVNAIASIEARKDVRHLAGLFETSPTRGAS